MNWHFFFKLSYYMEAIATASSGKLSIKVNAQMFDTGLTDQISGNIQNEVQTININSSIVYESYVIQIESFL